MVFANFATSCNTQLSVYSQVSCYSLVNKDEYLIYYAYTPVQSAITFDSLGRCFRFVYIILYACTFFCVATVFR